MTILPTVIWPAVLLLLVTAGCDRGEPATALPERADRFGIFRDLVLFQRRSEDGGAFFMDRFESTRADYHTFALARGASAGGGNARSASFRQDWPITGIDLLRAREFARWRFCRVQRFDEWDFARQGGGGSHRFPWGSRWEPTWCNTADLGLGRPAPVGAFESGRSRDGPYDLIGNVREWTESLAVPGPALATREETIRLVDGLLLSGHAYGRLPTGLRTASLPWLPVPHSWLLHNGNWGPVERRAVWIYMPGETTLRASAAISPAVPDWIPAPTGWLAMAANERLPRFVVGGHFQQALTPDPIETAASEESDDYTGLRLAVSPVELIDNLIASDAEPTAADVRLLRRFLAANADVLRPAWRRMSTAALGSGRLSELLRQELGPLQE